MATLIRTDIPIQIEPMPEFIRARIEAIRKMKAANIRHILVGGGRYVQRKGAKND